MIQTIKTSLDDEIQVAKCGVGFAITNINWKETITGKRKVRKSSIVFLTKEQMIELAEKINQTIK